MADNDISFVISGKNAEKAAKKLKKIVDAEFGIDAELYREPQIRRQERVMEFDPVALATMILTIPPAVVATLDIVQKIKNRKKLDKTKEEGLKISLETQTTIKIQCGHKIEEISETNSMEIINSSLKKD